MQQNPGFCLCIQSITLCLLLGNWIHFYEEILKTSDCWLFPVTFVVWGGIMFILLSSLGFLERRFLSWFLYGVVFPSLYCSFPSIFWRFGFVERYCVNLVLSWNTLVSPSTVIDSFAGYSSLGWHLCSLRVCMTSAQDRLAFLISGEKSGVILIGLLYMLLDLLPLLLLIFYL